MHFFRLSPAFRVYGVATRMTEDDPTFDLTKKKKKKKKTAFDPEADGEKEVEFNYQSLYNVHNFLLQNSELNEI